MPSHLHDVPDPVWSFAYGANTSDAKLQAAGIHPIASKIGDLPGHQLVFSSSLSDGPQEPAFAEVRAVRASHVGTATLKQVLSPVQGVLNQLDPKDLAKLDKTEGSLYHRVQLPVQLRDRDHTSVLAWVYVSKDYPSSTVEADTKDHLKPSVPGIGVSSPSSASRAPEAGATLSSLESAPSERYARLIVCGEKQHHLDHSWIKALQEHLEQLGVPPSTFSSCSNLQPHLRLSTVKSQSFGSGATKLSTDTLVVADTAGAVKSGQGRVPGGMSQSSQRRASVRHSVLEARHAVQDDPSNKHRIAIPGKATFGTNKHLQQSGIFLDADFTSSETLAVATSASSLIFKQPDACGGHESNREGQAKEGRSTMDHPVEVCKVSDGPASMDGRSGQPLNLRRRLQQELHRSFMN